MLDLFDKRSAIKSAAITNWGRWSDIVADMLPETMHQKWAYSELFWNVFSRILNAGKHRPE